MSKSELCPSIDVISKALGASKPWYGGLDNEKDLCGECTRSLVRIKLEMQGTYMNRKAVIVLTENYLSFTHISLRRTLTVWEGYHDDSHSLKERPLTEAERKKLWAKYREVLESAKEHKAEDDAKHARRDERDNHVNAVKRACGKLDTYPVNLNWSDREIQVSYPENATPKQVAALGADIH